MFGFRGGSKRRNEVHSNAKRGKGGKSRAVAAPTKNNRNHGLKAIEQQAPTPQSSYEEPIETERFMDENSSVDMSLYTTLSKATVRYPPRLLNYSFEDDDDDDDSSDGGISRAPTMFTTEVVLNRHARLGGSWTPPSPLNTTPAGTAARAITTTPATLLPHVDGENKTLTPTTDPTQSDDDGSLAASSTSSCDCEETTYSLLPATAKMARLAHSETRATRTITTTRTPLIRNTSSLEAHGSAESREETPQPEESSSQWNSRISDSHTGPVDLDESVEDSASVASSTNSWVASPSPGKVSNQSYESLDEQIERNYGLPSSDPASHRSARDDGIHNISSAASSTGGADVSRTLGRTLILSPQQARDSPQNPTCSPGISSVGSQSWVQRQKMPVGYDDTTVQSSIRDDDTYGFTVTSAQKSVATTETGGVPPREQVRRVELFKQWEEDSYKNSTADSILSKSRAIKSSLFQFCDGESTNMSSSTVSPTSARASRASQPQKSAKSSTGSRRESNAANIDQTRVPSNVISCAKSLTSRGFQRVQCSNVVSQRKDATATKQSVASKIEKPLDNTSPPDASRTKEFPKALRSVPSNASDDDCLENLIASSLARPKAVRRLQQDISNKKASGVSTLSKANNTPPPKRDTKNSSSPAFTPSQTSPKLINRSGMTDSSRNFPQPAGQTNCARLSNGQIERFEAVVESPIKSTAVEKPVLSSYGEQVSPGAKSQFVRNDAGDSRHHESNSLQGPSIVIDSDICGLTTVSALTPALMEPMDDDTYGFSTASPAHIPALADDATLGYGSLASPIVRDDGSLVWADQQGADWDADRNREVIQQHIASELLDQTYQQATDSLSAACRSHGSGLIVSAEDGDHRKAALVNSPGGVLLTETELNKHLKKSERVQPLPSSEIEGYDAWKRQRERQQRHFTKLQAKTTMQQKGEKKDQRQPSHDRQFCPPIDSRQHTNHVILRQKRNVSEDVRCMDSTRSAMDQSMDSSIPTIDDGKWKPRKKERRIGWGWFQKKKKKKGPKKESGKDTNLDKSRDTPSRSDGKKKSKKELAKCEAAIVPLSQFMKISADEPADVADFSLAPLHKGGVLTLGTSTLPDGADTVAGTKSHNLDSVGVSPRKLVTNFKEDERRKQHQAQIDGMMDQEFERERIAKRRQEAIEEQRRLNLYNKKTPTQDRTSASFDHNSAERNKLDKIYDERPRGSASGKFRCDEEAIDKNISVDSKHSANSSMKSGSGLVLSPCVVCNDAERTHIAMPCMHFFFCEHCVERLYQANSPVCPVCSTADVAFTRVYTG